LFQI